MRPGRWNRSVWESAACILTLGFLVLGELYTPRVLEPTRDPILGMDIRLLILTGFLASAGLVVLLHRVRS